MNVPHLLSVSSISSKLTLLTGAFVGRTVMKSWLFISSAEEGPGRVQISSYVCANVSCRFKFQNYTRANSRNHKVKWRKRNETEYNEASLSIITQTFALSSCALQVQKLWLHSKTVYWAFVWFVDVHCAPAVSSAFRLILCFWVYFISLKASMFLLPVSITVIQSFILMGPGNLCLCETNTQSRKCLQITDQWVHFFLIKHFFLFSILDGNHFNKSMGWSGHELMAFFWWISHLRRNKSTLLERDMEKWVFMIPITTFALL